MSQINKYADKAAYEADTARLKTLSSESYIENDGVLLYDGVNTVVRKSAAGVGDLVVFDKTDGVLKFIKGATLVAEKIPSALVPAGVVYGRHGDKVRIVSLDNATYNGAMSIQWAAPYEVALSGFDLAAGGTFTLRIYNTDFEFTYPAGATLASIAAQINANSDITNTYSWKATASDELNAIVMECNAWSTTEGHKKISATGCTLTKHAEDVDYQTITAIIPQNTTANVRRRNGADTQLAGCDNEVFLEYCSVNGTTNTNILPGSSTIIRESVFTEADNPALVAAYPTYRDYLFGEHLAEYPSAYGAFLQDGKSNTAILAGKTRTDFYGKIVPCYPAAAAAAAYGMQVAGMTTGLEAGAWWLPSAEEAYILMRDRVLTAADVAKDPVNLSLTRLGKATCYGAGYDFKTSCERGANSSFMYNGLAGYIGYQYKTDKASVRPVTEI